jgi:3-oxoacyl-[acyl-carrier protein] reductase
VNLDLEGRVALVTGGARGIGRGIADGLAAEGVNVAIASRSAGALGALGNRQQGFAFDTADLAGIDPLVDAVEADMGPLDIVVLNTGGPTYGEDPLAFTAEQWEAAHRSMVVSPMLLLARVVPGMRERRFGRVLATGSTGVREPLHGLQLSNANRPGLMASLKLLAREGAADGLTFNAVLPGRIATDRAAQAFGGLEAAEEQARADVPAGRLGTVAEIADLAVFLCSGRASYVTGQAVAVDGGLTRSW